MQSAWSDIISAAVRWRIWFLMANQDILLRYRRSALGPFWISIAMAAMILGISLLYSQILHVPFREYITFLACGLMAWNFISGLVTDSANSVVDSEYHLRALPLPISLFSMRAVYRNLIIFGHNLIVVLAILLIVDHFISPLAFLALVGVVIYCVVGFLMGLVLAPLCARFRDVPQLIANAMQILFFLTPIFWRPGQVSPNNPAVQLNPFFHLVELIRAPLLGTLPQPRDWLASFVLIVVLAALSIFSLGFTKRKIFLWI